MKKKKKRKKIKIRHSWGDLKPATQVHSVDTDYNRAKHKKDWKEQAQGDLDSSNDLKCT